MDNWDKLAIITFITCDAILENIYEIRNLYIYYYRDIKKRLRDRQQNIYMIIYEEKHKNNNRYKMINIKKTIQESINSIEIFIVDSLKVNIKINPRNRFKW